jgi:hypothetical protein
MANRNHSEGLREGLLLAIVLIVTNTWVSAQPAISSELAPLGGKLRCNACRDPGPVAANT